VREAASDQASTGTPPRPPTGAWGRVGRLRKCRPGAVVATSGPGALGGRVFRGQSRHSTPFSAVQLDESPQRW